MKSTTKFYAGLAIGPVVALAVLLCSLATHAIPVTSRAAGQPQGKTPVNPEPCCTITSINSATGVVFAKVNATGQTFQFKANPQEFASLQVGKGIFANFKTRQVSLNGQTPFASILSIGTLPRGANPSATMKAPSPNLRFFISSQQGGFHLQLPAKLVSRFPRSAKIQITLDDDQKGKTTVNGTFTKLSGNTLQVSTPEAFSYSQGGPRTWLLLRVLGVSLTNGGGSESCGGCSRDSTLMPFEGDDHTCYCMQGVKPVSWLLRLPSYGGCGGGK